MVVNQQKMPNKHKGRTPVEVLSQSEASHQSQKSKSTDRVSNTSQREGKRKAPVAQNTEPFGVANKTGRSNQRKLGIGKSDTNLSFSAKGNQIFQKIVGSQQDGVGPTYHNEVFTFETDMAQLTEPGSKANPSSSIKNSHQTLKLCYPSQPRKVSATVINCD